MRARDVMSTPVVTVRLRTPVTQAANLLATKGFTALPVLDENERLIGIVTEADLARSDEASHPIATTVGEVMTSPGTATGAGTDVVELVIEMLDNRMRAMPIVDGSRVVGIVTRRDLVGALARDDHAIAVSA